MTEYRVNLLLKLDPDFKNAVSGLVVLVRDAYDRGAISWLRRCELIDTLPERVADFLEVRTYERPHADPDTVLVGMFAEPSAAFLAEIGLMGQPS